MIAIKLIMGACLAVLGFFFGLFICCFLATLVGFPHPYTFGTVGWVLLLSSLISSAYRKARADYQTRMSIVQASVEAQAREVRDEKLVNKPLWD